jgi:hypothetical protein
MKLALILMVLSLTTREVSSAVWVANLLGVAAGLHVTWLFHLDFGAHRRPEVLVPAAVRVARAA